MGIARFIGAWADSDGKHVWIAHQCADGPVEYMLPYPTWQASEDGRTAYPSFACGRCTLHTTSPFNLDAGPPPKPDTSR